MIEFIWLKIQISSSWYPCLRNELEIQQDEEMEKISKKEKTVALVAEKDKEEENVFKYVVVIKSTPSTDNCESRTDIEVSKYYYCWVNNSFKL